MIELQGSIGMRSILIEAFGSKTFFVCLKSVDYHKGICCICTLALTVAKTGSYYDCFAISVPAKSLLPSTSLSKMGTKAAPRGRGALEEMGTYPRHVLYFSRKFYLRQFDLFPKNQNFDPSCFDPIQKFGMWTRGLTLIFDPVPLTYFRPPSFYAFWKGF